MPTTKVYSPGELRAATARLPRVRLAHLPTPLEEAPRLSEALGGPRILIKRDDCTGLAFGGNKTRHNELIMGHALELGADLVVWGAGVQSNNCRQTAAACARFGLDCHLVLSRGAHHDDVQGNLLVDHIVGASYEVVEVSVGDPLDELISERAAAFRAAGRTVYCWDRKAVKSRAAVTYAECMAEMADQLAERDVEPAAYYICSAGSTGAGMALGRAALGISAPVYSIMPICWPWDEQLDLAETANRAAELAGLDVHVTPEEVNVSNEYVGTGYGIPTQAGMDAIGLVARTEGVLLDPTYTGKAMSALVADIQSGRYTSDDTVVFVHTGGTPALFAHRDEVVEMIPRREPPAA